QTVSQAALYRAADAIRRCSAPGVRSSTPPTLTSPDTGTPTGTVTFQDAASPLGTGTLSGGTATFTTSGLGTGAHSITAIYGGDANFTGSTSPILMQTINKTASSSSVVSSSNNPTITETDVTLPASPSSPVAGT